MLIFKSFLFTLPASITASVLCGFIMKQLKERQHFLMQSNLFFWSTGDVPFPSPKHPLCTPSTYVNRGKAGAMMGRRLWDWRLQKEDTSWQGHQDRGATWLWYSKKKKKILLHLWPPHLSKARKQNLPASPLPLPHRGPPLTKSEMVAYQRKAKLRIHKKVGSQVGGGP